MFAKAIAQPCKLAHLLAITAVMDVDALLSFISNLKLLEASARKAIIGIWETTDIIKISEEENYLLAQGEDSYYYGHDINRWAMTSARVLLVEYP